MKIQTMTKQGPIRLTLDESTLQYTIETTETAWKGDQNHAPVFYTGETVNAFTGLLVRHSEVHNGIGDGIRSEFDWFETYVWIERSTGDVRFEWIPLAGSEKIDRVEWPAPMAFPADRDDWYTVLNEQQGLMIPNSWPEPFSSLPFEGRYLTAGCYMPWFGQVRAGIGYIAIAETPWNGGIRVEHDGPGATSVEPWWEASLGRMEYRRILRYTFCKDSDYNTLAKIYRQYVFENGLAATLAEKAVRLPSVRNLIGCSFVHCGIKTHVNPKSSFFDPADPEKNNRLTTFAKRQEEILAYYDLGIRRLYLHLDGWAEPGYDNRHPDYGPACEEAGGWAGMKALASALQEKGFLFGIHDQYRDYYQEAPSYDADYAVQFPDGTHPEHARWAGGPQSYLCASQAPYYVRRNFNELLQHVQLDGAYLDVFTCNEADECANPRHRMSRRDGYEFRKKCFDWLIACGILPSSEEVSDWSMQSLVFCHYAPYAFQMEAPDARRQGVPVPLFNLVYHDCVIIPWMMDRHGDEDYMLYALLNGGAPYLRRDPAYVGIDGAFAGDQVPVEEQVQRSLTVSRLHEKVAMCEMVSHRFLDEGYRIQETVFSDGTVVRIDTGIGKYEIQPFEA